MKKLQQEIQCKNGVSRRSTEIRKWKAGKWLSLLIFFSLAAILPQTSPAKADEIKKSETFITLTRTALEAEKLPTNTTIVTHETIERTGAQNAVQALQYSAGLVVQRYAGLGSVSSAKMRGFNNRQVSIYVDNRRIPKDVTGDVDLSQIPAESIDRIEIVRGASSVLYGPDAEGGVIHIITKKAKGYLPFIEASAQGESFNTQIYRACVGLKKERAEGYLTVSKNRSDNYQKNSVFDNSSFGGNLGYDAGLFGKTMLYFSRSQSQVGLPSGTTVPISAWNGEIEREPRAQFQRAHDTNSSVQLEHAIDIYGKAFLTTRLASSELLKEYLSTSTGPVTEKTRLNRRSFYFQGDTFFGFTAGFEYVNEQIRSPYSVTPQTNGYGIFFQQNFSLENLTLIPGVRFDNNTEWGDTTNPRLSAIYQANPQIKLSANVGSAFQAPTFADFSDYAFNMTTWESEVLPRLSTAPALSPEKSWQYDAGMELNLAESFVGKITLFRSDVRNRLSYGYTPDGSRFTTSNLQKAYTQGVEMEVSQSPFKWLDYSLNYTYLMAKGRGFESNILGENYSNEYVDLNFVPRNQFNSLFTFNIPGNVSIGQSFKYVGEQWSEANRRGVKLPDYLTWDMQAGLKVKEIQFNLGVKNVMERRYAEIGNFGTYYPQPGRTFWGGMTVRFM